MKISDVMTPSVYSISADTTVEAALDKMGLYKVRHMPVVDASGMVGLLSERDARLCHYVCRTTESQPTVGEICEKDPYVVSEATDLAEIALEMADRKIECALVVNDSGDLLGIFTTTDACRVISMILEERNLPRDA
jgi:CBS domain-containing protein